MAIAYKSQGAGVATETTGAALSPLCPATVDAGDVLIAHVYAEGVVDAPNTPGGWTLLSGPHVIQTTVARHWVFGRIADGSEDGAAVAFGSWVSVNQRGARVYSFSGRVSGTITEIVNGFAATSHATDPQMPTVTTTIIGALAVALVGQNDNNAQASPTGETGGDWVEAVAEFLAALTPGIAMGIHTATPTANPGTITGGAIATGNDPVGVIGFQIMPEAVTQGQLSPPILLPIGATPSTPAGVRGIPFFLFGTGAVPGGFPTQYAGLRVWDDGAVKELCLVATADAPAGMGGQLRIRKGGTTLAVYLVETTDPNASRVRLRTTTGTKAARLKT